VIARGIVRRAEDQAKAKDGDGNAVKKEVVADADIELMLRKNPARLLGLEG